MEKCTDIKCPEHGKLKTRGRAIEATVVSDKMQGTISVGWTYKVDVPKYERKAARKSKIKAHNPPCINAKLGDRVLVSECRPLSKTVSFVVTKILGKKE